MEYNLNCPYCMKRREISRKASAKYKKTKKGKLTNKKSYFKNKTKYLSRGYTKNMVIKELIPFCKKCGKEGYEIHHEIYPIKAKEIRQAVQDGKIYYLCKKHHNELLLNRMS